MYTLYSMQDSGNCYKLRLAMAQLDVRFQIRDVDILKGESRSIDFLKINPNGKVPTLVLPDGRPITESDAALFYLAEGSKLLPEGRFARAEVLQWMFFEQYSHEPYIAVARYWLTIAPDGRETKKECFKEWNERGHHALRVMERQLNDKDFFAGGRYSIADIALYAYTHMADEGDFDLSGYPAINRWLERVRSQPGHVDIHWRP